jgi:hypothetical protein
MKASPHGGGVSRRLLVVGLVGVSVLAVPWLAALAKLETWREESASAFGKGRRERVVISDNGRVRLGHALKPMDTVEAARVWDLARGKDGELFAATGDDGKVFRRASNEGSTWSVVYDAPDTQALCVAVGPDGQVFAGTGPSGQVVELTNPKHPSSRPGPEVQYVWDLATDPQCNLYAATGPNGQLWKRSKQGTWSLLYDSRHSHLLCVAVAPDGSVYTGSDGEGLVYKVAPGGKVSVVYDAPQSEVRTLLLRPDGSLYAGTAAESGGGSGRGPLIFPGGGTPGGPSPFGSRPTESSSAAASTPAQNPPAKGDASGRDAPRTKPGGSSGGSATIRPLSPGDNAVYRIDPDGVVREVFRAKALVFALAMQDDHLLVGTGPEGQLYEVRDDGHESAPVARLDSGHILSLLSDPSGGLLIGTADPGSVVRLDPGYVVSGTLTSEVRDTKLISRFGSVTWRAERPAGTSVSVQVRSGNVSEPDSTWSDWSAEQTEPSDGGSSIPPGRFVQYRVKLATRDPSVSPELHSVTLRYQSANLPPEITRLDVPDVSALDGTTRQTRMTIRWDVNDPNDDDLNYTLHLCKDGWPDWVKLNDQPITEKSFAWDTTSVPAGTYRVRLSASDRPSNNPADALSRERVSEPFIVDHEAPEVVIKTNPRGASVSLRDKLTRIVKAAYALDGGDWVPVFPDDGLFDTPNEAVTVSLPDLKPGSHIVMVRATDAAGNVGTGDALIEAK